MEQDPNDPMEYKLRWEGNVLHVCQGDMNGMKLRRNLLLDELPKYRIRAVKEMVRFSVGTSRWLKIIREERKEFA